MASRQNLIGGVVGVGHEFAQLGAGVYPELGERIVQMGFHRVRRDVQPLCHRPVGNTLRDQVDDLELGVGEAVPARFCPRRG